MESAQSAQTITREELKRILDEHNLRLVSNIATHMVTVDDFVTLKSMFDEMQKQMAAMAENIGSISAFVALNSEMKLPSKRTKEVSAAINSTSSISKASTDVVPVITPINVPNIAGPASITGPGSNVNIGTFIRTNIATPEVYALVPDSIKILIKKELTELDARDRNTLCKEFIQYISTDPTGENIKSRLLLLATK